MFKSGSGKGRCRLLKLLSPQSIPPILFPPLSLSPHFYLWVSQRKHTVAIQNRPGFLYFRFHTPNYSRDSLLCNLCCALSLLCVCKYSSTCTPASFLYSFSPFLLPTRYVCHVLKIYWNLLILLETICEEFFYE